MSTFALTVFAAPEKPSVTVIIPEDAGVAVEYAAVYAALYWLPIVIINVIISGGSRNGEAMLVSSVLCALFTVAAAVRSAKKKV